MQEKIERLLEELGCITYKYDKNDITYKNVTFLSNEHLMYKELVKITSELSKLNIEFQIDEDNNILLFKIW
uniref:hypothetical protein n=1 Tax=Aliarcobacter sp. TaxID=2321116 RepID=UPI004047B379